MRVTEDLYYIGASDRRIALFESAFPVPRGVSYNSYLLLDEKTVLFDTVDAAVTEEFLHNLESVLGARTLDYLVVQHVEPDHSASFARVLERYPEVCVVASAKAAVMLKNFFSYEGATVVKEGDVLETGKHRLRFLAAPMVHWPEVLFTYDEAEGTLFSADAFGTFGALGGSIFADEVQFERDFLDDARRYYFNIVGKYGVQVQSVLKKAAALEIKTVCPLHGPIWRKNFAWYLQKYDIWSKYAPETQGAAVFYASIYGHTQNAAEILAAALAAEGVKEIAVYDVSVTDKSVLLAEAFRYSHAVFLSPTYNNGIFVNMEDFLRDLCAHGYCNRRYALAENGSWAPQAARLMQETLSSCKNMQKIGESVTVLSAVTTQNAQELKALAREIAKSFD